jgi:hypothetical protein
MNLVTTLHTIFFNQKKILNCSRNEKTKDGSHASGVRRLYLDAGAYRFKPPHKLQLPEKEVFYVNMSTQRKCDVHKLKSSISWRIMPYGPLEVNRRFGGICLLHIQGQRIK